MKLDSNTVLITGGASGIGLALAKRFVAAGSLVIVCGRSEEKLRAAKAAVPALITRACDVGEKGEREALAAWATSTFPPLNVLVNNAGIQRRVNLQTSEPWEETESELSINLAAPIHLTKLFIPHLLTREAPTLVNVTSGLAFVPATFAPIYAATKAALHSFTMATRAQLAKTPIAVYELIPPAVNTDLGGVGLHDMGVPLDEYADSAFEGLKRGQLEVGYGSSEIGRKASRAELDAAFERLSRA